MRQILHAATVRLIVSFCTAYDRRREREQRLSEQLERQTQALEAQTKALEAIAEVLLLKRVLLQEAPKL